MGFRYFSSWLGSQSKYRDTKHKEPTEVNGMYMIWHIDMTVTPGVQPVAFGCMSHLAYMGGPIPEGGGGGEGWTSWAGPFPGCGWYMSLIHPSALATYPDLGAPPGQPENPLGCLHYYYFRSLPPTSLFANLRPLHMIHWNQKNKNKIIDVLQWFQQIFDTSYISNLANGRDLMRTLVY